MKRTSSGSTRFQSGDVKLVGGKNASLGEMIAHLKNQGVRVPEGFATTASAYWDYIAANGIEAKLRDRLEALTAGKASLQEVGADIRRLFLEGEFPEPLANAINQSYWELSRRAGVEAVSVAVRSSATAEDLPQASFAGQQETFLNVRGERDLLDACRRCYASLFTDRAISYRDTMGFDHLQVALSIGVQRMVRADLAGSGVMFSIDTETGFPGVVVISAAWGLGETVVQGTVNPDKYLVFKPLLADELLRPILEKTLGAKERKLVYAEGGSGRTRYVNTTKRERRVLRAQRRRDPDSWRAGPWLSSGTTAARWTWSGRRTARPASLPSSRRGRKRCSRRRPGAPSEPIASRRRASGWWRAPPSARPSRRDEVCLIRDAADIARFRDGADPCHRSHRPRLGADHEAGGRHRHRSRRRDEPRRDRQPRAWPPGGRRHAARHRDAARRAGDHGVLRRGRGRLRL